MTLTSNAELFLKLDYLEWDSIGHELQNKCVEFENLKCFIYHHIIITLGLLS